MNDNCLAGLSCPKCGQEERIHIQVYGWGIVDDDGVSELDSIEWEDDSYALCADPDCGGEGTVRAFQDNTAFLEECGCCGQYHRLERGPLQWQFKFYGGDCRNDDYRFASLEDALERLGVSHEWDGVLAPPVSAVELLERETLDEQGFEHGPWYSVERIEKGTGDKS